MTKAIEIDPEIAKAYSYRGYCYYRMIQYEEAIVDFEIALKLDSNYSEINYYYMGRIFFNIEDYKTAINYFSNAIEINDKESDYYYYRGSSYDLLKIFDNAEEDFRKACALGESSGCEAVEGIVKKRIREKKSEKNDVEETK